MYKTFITSFGKPIWAPYESNNEMQRSVYWHPSGGRREQTIGIFLSQGRGRREYGAQELRLPYFVIFLAKFLL